MFAKHILDAARFILAGVVGSHFDQVHKDNAIVHFELVGSHFAIVHFEVFGPSCGELFRSGSFRVVGSHFDVVSFQPLQSLTTQLFISKNTVRHTV